MSTAVSITSLDDAKLSQVLGAGDPDASDGVLYAVHDQNNRKKLSFDQRVLFIGLGGQGIKTVNRIKANVAAKFEDYTDKIAFLAIDTDWDDLGRQIALREDEKFCIRCNKASTDAVIDPAKRSDFSKSWVNPEFHVDLTKPGANQVREACAAKLFDATKGANPNDQQIITWIGKCADRVLEAFDGNTMKMTVNIIAGISGGTGSGSIVEMAHFCRRAIQQQHEINGYLLLPDVVKQYVIGTAAWQNVQANGYAALKELDYYYSESQRELVYKDRFDTSVTALGPVYFDRDNPLYNQLYLISGSNGAAAKDPNKTAVETITEALINQLAENAAAKGAAQSGSNVQFLSSSFSANEDAEREAKLPTLYDQVHSTHSENYGCCGEDTFRYGALGVATASIPEQTIKCYTVTKIMRTILGRTDGFTPTSEFAGFARVPLNGIEASNEINKLLSRTPKVLENKILDYCREQLVWPEEHQDIDRNEIVARNWGTLKTELTIPAKRTKVFAAINEFLDKSYTEFKNALYQFLVTYGPLAFRDMLDGIDSTGAHYKGSLRNVIFGYMGFNVTNLSAINTTRSSTDLDIAYDKVKAPITGLLPNNRTGFHGAYLEDQQMQLAAETAALVFGEAGAYRTRYLNLIMDVCEQVKVFANVFEKLYGIYENMGGKFDSQETFNQAALQENATNINVISSVQDYNWACDIVAEHARTLDYDTIKKEIINSFLRDPKSWTEFDSTRPQENPRRVLDTIMAPYVDMDDKLTIVSYINHKLSTGADMDATIFDLVRKLSIVSKPLYNVQAGLAAQVDGSSFHYLMVPDVMFTMADGGAQLNKSFTDACNRINNTALFPCNVGDQLVFYTQYAALPLYALQDLKQWESVYDHASRTCIHRNESGMGFYNKDEGLAWEDYPALALEQDPRQLDNMGNRSREGDFFVNKLDPLFKEAVKKNIIVKEKDTDGKISYYAYVLDIPGWDITVDLDEYNDKDDDGFYKTGEAVFRYIAKKNGSGVEKMRRRIALLDQSFFNETTDEKIAEDHAKRALRRNVPLFISVKKTLALWSKIGKEIDAANAALTSSMAAKYVPYYVATGMLAPNAKKQWILNEYGMEDSRNISICNLNPLALMDDPLADNEYFYEILCRAFLKKMSGDPDVAECYKESWQLLLDEPETYAVQFKTRMDAFGEEAKKFLAVAEGTSIPAQKKLMSELKLNANDFEEMKNHYSNFRKFYKMVCAQAASVE